MDLALTPLIPRMGLARDNAARGYRLPCFLRFLRFDVGAVEFTYCVGLSIHTDACRWQRSEVNSGSASLLILRPLWDELASTGTATFDWATFSPWKY
jgi:hypothetical protein